MTKFQIGQECYIVKDYQIYPVKINAIIKRIEKDIEFLKYEALYPNNKPHTISEAFLVATWEEAKKIAIDNWNQIYNKVLGELHTNKGYSFVDLLQPCVTFNKLNTWKWFRENVYYLDESHDVTNRVEAFKRATDEGKLPLGVFYKNNKNTFEENLPVYKTNKDPLFRRDANLPQLQKLIDSMRK